MEDDINLGLKDDFENKLDEVIDIKMLLFSEIFSEFEFKINIVVVE